MPDALQMLRDDHNEVKEIFRKFSSTDDTNIRKQLARQAMMKLEVHSNLEEEFFYPAVRAEGGTKQLMNEAEEEHHLADLLMDELRVMSPDDDHYEAKFEVLAESVRHHIDEEESEIFPKAAELGQDRLRQIGERMAKRKPALMQQAEKPKRAAPASRASARRTTARGAARRTTRAASGSRTSTRSARASGSRASATRATRSTAGVNRARSTPRATRGNGARSTSRSTHGTSARSSSGRSTRSASAPARGSRTGARTTAATTSSRNGATRGRTAMASRRSTASRSSSSRPRTSRR